MFTLRAVSDEAMKLYPFVNERTFSGQTQAFRHLDACVTAQVVANHVVKMAYRNVIDRGLRDYSYQEHSWIVTDQRAMKIAEAVLKARYGDVTLDVDDDENSVRVTWNAQAPAICTPVEAQERKNGKLFAYVASNQITKAMAKIEKGADKDARGPFNRTPLYAVMAESGQLEKLIAKGANVNVVDDFGMSPLDVARSFSSSSPFVDVLLRHGAKPGNQISSSSDSAEVEQMIKHLTSLGYTVQPKK